MSFHPMKRPGPRARSVCDLLKGNSCFPSSWGVCARLESCGQRLSLSRVCVRPSSSQANSYVTLLMTRLQTVRPPPESNGPLCPAFKGRARRMKCRRRRVHLPPPRATLTLGTDKSSQSSQFALQLCPMIYCVRYSVRRGALNSGRERGSFLFVILNYFNKNFIS